MSERRKISAAYSDFIVELDRLLALDARNQGLAHPPGPGPVPSPLLSKGQMTLITEGIFARAFSCFESLLEDAFLLYCRGSARLSGRAVATYVRPRNSSHVRDLIKAERATLDWNNPDTVIRRCDLFFKTGSPIKAALASNRASLTNMRYVRNAIAHRSPEAHTRYVNVVRAELLAPPLTMPSPGEFLLMSVPASGNYFLRQYLATMKNAATQACT